jgi:hypothetical protein
MRARITPDLLAIFETGGDTGWRIVLALLAVAWAVVRWPGRSTVAAGWLFVAGIVLFSGSLYARWSGARLSRLDHAVWRPRVHCRLVLPAGAHGVRSKPTKHGVRRWTCRTCARLSGGLALAIGGSVLFSPRRSSSSWRICHGVMRHADRCACVFRPVSSRVPEQRGQVRLRQTMGG